MASTNPIVKEHLKASEAHAKQVLKSKEEARKFLVRAGLITPQGRLKKPYR